MDLPKIEDLASCGDPEYLEALTRLLLRLGFGSSGVSVVVLTPKEALTIGKREGPHKSTRLAACREPKWAYYYALQVDKGPREDTRQAACGEPYWACQYALEVGEEFQEETWAAVQGTNWEY